MQLPQYGDERRNARAACYKIALSFVFDGTPVIVYYQFIACLQFTYLIGYAIMVRIAFNGELEIRFIIQAGECERAFFITPFRLADSHLGGMSRCKMVSLRFFKTDTPDIVRHLR